MPWYVEGFARDGEFLVEQTNLGELDDAVVRDLSGLGPDVELFAATFSLEGESRDRVARHLGRSELRPDLDYEIEYLRD